MRSFGAISVWRHALRPPVGVEILRTDPDSKPRRADGLGAGLGFVLAVIECDVKRSDVKTGCCWAVRSEIFHLFIRKPNLDRNKFKNVK